MSLARAFGVAAALSLLAAAILLLIEGARLSRDLGGGGMPAATARALPPKARPEVEARASERVRSEAVAAEAGPAAGASPGAGLDPLSAAIAPRPATLPRGFDAVAGTVRDPLLNKTYDLTFAKTVPELDRPRPAPPDPKARALPKKKEAQQKRAASASPPDPTPDR